MTTTRPRPRLKRVVIDVALALLVGWLLIAGYGLSTTIGTDEPPFSRRGRREIDLVVPVVVKVAIGLAMLAVATRRWHRLGAWLVGLVGIGLYLAHDGLFMPAVLTLVLLGLTLTAQQQLRRTWPWLLLMVPAYAAADPGSPGHWFSVATMMIWTMLPIGLAAWIGQRREERRRARADELARATHDERLRMARDIHDVVGHSLSLISLQSGVALKVLSSDPEQARASLEAIRSSSKQALDEVRRALGVFREGEVPLAPTPDLAAIATLVEQVQATGAQVSLTPLPTSAGVPLVVQTVAHRIVQEALTNALRHAPGAAVTVGVDRTSEGLRVKVADTQPGPAEIVEGAGLTGMRERVASLGGQVSLTPGAGGLVVEAQLPVVSDGAAGQEDEES